MHFVGKRGKKNKGDQAEPTAEEVASPTPQENAAASDPGSGEGQEESEPQPEPRTVGSIIRVAHVFYLTYLTSCSCCCWTIFLTYLIFTLQWNVIMFQIVNLNLFKKASELISTEWIYSVYNYM